MSDVRVGCVGYSHERGLGRLVKSFYDHGVIDSVLPIRHPSIPFQDWYSIAPLDLSKIDETRLKAFCLLHDVMLFFETPFHWPILDFCRARGIRTYLVTMYECTPIVRPHPHKYLCPSPLDVDYFREWDHEEVHLPVEYPWRLRERARHFVHNGGYLGIRHREGTLTLIDAMRFVKTPVRLTIRCQENIPPSYVEKCKLDKRIEYLPQQIPYLSLYAEGDVSIGAQKWNGCSLPLQESFASGMLVMNTDRYPMNTWLPRDPLIPVAQYIKDRSIGRGYLLFEEAEIDPKSLAKMIDEWYGQDITHFSLRGREWAKANSWEVLGPKWKELLKS